MYSRWQPPRGVIKLKGSACTDPWLARIGAMCVRTFDHHTYYVYDYNTRIVEAIYYAKPNGHGWSPSKAHAMTHLIRHDEFNPFDLDAIP